MSAGPPEAAGAPPVEQNPVDHRSPTPPARVVRAWQHANRISTSHALGIFGASFLVGQALLALVLWWLRVPGWFDVGYWLANGVFAWVVFFATRKRTRVREQQATREGSMLTCDEALASWQQELLGLPGDPRRLEQAHEHLRPCSLRCAQLLGTAPFPEEAKPGHAAGTVDLYEALGLEAEEQGDAHAAVWARLAALAESDEADIQRERELALACWLGAASAYRQGQQVEEAAYLRASLARLADKRLPTTLGKAVL